MVEKPSVLIVDDEVRFCQHLGKEFDRRGWAPASAHDGAAALGRLASELEDVMLLDIILPGETGIETLKKGTDAYGMRCRVKVVKNKVAAPFRVAEFDVIFNKGISAAGAVADMAIAQNIIAQSGSWFSYGDQRLGQGRDAIGTLVVEVAKLRGELEVKVRAGLGIDPPAPVAAKKEDE